MSDSASPGFGSFIPGFDFLQNLAKGTSSAIPQVPNLGQWVAPTLSVEDLDKRIDELKNVQFWLEQNSRALAATIQALEVQKMTLATLKGMHLNLGDLAAAFTNNAAAAAPGPVGGAAQASPQEPRPQAAAKTPDPADASASAAQTLIDPLQLWGSLTQQFQAIAASALHDVAAHRAPATQPPAASASVPRKKSAASRSTTAKTTGTQRASRTTAATKKTSTR